MQFAQTLIHGDCHEARRPARSNALASGNVLGTTGCGLINNGIEVRSVPDGAQITTQPVTETITTPASLNLERTDRRQSPLRFPRIGKDGAFRIESNLSVDVTVRPRL